MKLSHVFLALLALWTGVFSAHAQLNGTNYWVGSTGSFNEPANWDRGLVPGFGEDAYIDNGGTVLITASDPDWAVRDIRTGETTNSTGGGVIQSGGNVVQTGWFRLGRTTNTTGSYELSGGSMTVSGETRVGENGAGVMNVTGGTYLGGAALHLGTMPGSGASGILNISGGSMTVANSSGGVQIGNASNTVGTLNLNGGDFTFIAGGMSVGRDAGSVGHLNITNGTFTARTEVFVGRRGVGTVNMVGGSFIMDQAGANGRINVGDRSTAGSEGSYGTMNQSGGVLDVAYFSVGISFRPANRDQSGLYNLSGTGQINTREAFIVGRDGDNGRMEMTGGTVNSSTFFAIGHQNGAQGVLNQSGGTLTHTDSNAIIGRHGNLSQAGPTGIWTLSGTAQARVPILELGQGNATATLNLNGGTFTVDQILTTKTGGTATLNLNGGVLRAGTSTSQFMQGLSAANVLANGAVIDTAGNDITIEQNLVDAGGNGGLTKSGSGTLTLAGTNTYTGNTTVQAGTLQLNVACLSGNAAVRVGNLAALNLNFSGTNQVGGFFVNGVDQGTGLFGASTHPDVITGQGKLQVGAAATPVTLTQVGVTGGGNYQISIAGSGSQIIQASTNLADVNAWVSLTTNSAPFTFIDTNAVNLYPQRFYRTVTP